jgi:hypothetical protein
MGIDGAEIKRRRLLREQNVSIIEKTVSSHLELNPEVKEMVEEISSQALPYKEEELSNKRIGDRSFLALEGKYIVLIFIGISCIILILNISGIINVLDKGSALFVFGLIIIIGLIYFAAKVEQKSKELEISIGSYFSSIENFHPTYEIFGCDNETGIAIDEDKKQICLFTNKRYLSHRLISFSDIISAEIHENGVSVTQTSSSSVVGRAVVGGLLLGGVGAIIGGLSAKKESNSISKVDRIELRITVNDLSDPLHDIVFLNRSCDRAGYFYNKEMQNARQWLGMIDVIINQSKANK